MGRNERPGRNDFKKFDIVQLTKIFMPFLWFTGCPIINKAGVTEQSFVGNETTKTNIRYSNLYYSDSFVFVRVSS